MHNDNTLIIEHEPANPAYQSEFDRWYVWQSWLGDLYEVACVYSEREALAVVRAFREQGCPEYKTPKWHAIERRLDDVVDAVRAC